MALAFLVPARALLINVHGAGVGLLPVALGLIHRAQVLELAVEVPLQPRGDARLARLTGEGARNLTASIPDRLTVAVTHGDPAEPFDASAVDPGDPSRTERPGRCLVEG